MPHEEAQSKETCLPVCVEIKKSNKAMHKCKYCQVAVSQICSCNVEDPDSDNPMHRVHKSRDLCAPSREKTCPKCGKKDKSEAILKCHTEMLYFEVTKEHQDIMEEDEEYDFAFKCRSCNYETNLKKDLEHHLKWNHNLKKNIQKALITSRKNKNSCEHCNKQFSRDFNLRRHEEKFHGQ